MRPDVNFMWITLIVGILGVLMAVIGWAQVRGRSDLGSVSDQWIAEHRSQNQNLPR